VTQADTPSDNFYRAVIGEPNQEFYLSYFRRADSRGYAPISWHWPVFVIGLFWLLYRKQYRFAVIVFVAPYLMAIVAALIDTVLPGTGKPLAWLGAVAFAFVWLPLNANGLYYRWSREQIARARLEFPGQVDAQERALEARGGVNAQLPYVVVIGFIVMMLMLAGSVTQLSQ